MIKRCDHGKETQWQAMKGGLAVSIMHSGAAAAATTTAMSQTRLLASYHLSQLLYDEGISRWQYRQFFIILQMLLFGAVKLPMAC